MTARGWTLFAVVAVIWGVPYLFIKLAVVEISPVFLAWARVTIAAACLFPIAWKVGALHGLRARLWPLVLYAVVEVCFPFPLIGFGETRVSSSLAAILIATVPLVVAVLAVRFDHSERPTGMRLLGLFVGFGGVIALLGIDVAGNPAELVGALALLLAAVGYAIGPMIIKHRFSKLDPVGTMAVSMGLASLFLLPAAIPTAPTNMPSAQVIESVIVLGTLCSALAFVLFSQLITEIGPGRATVITYINPVIAVALGVTLLGEHVTAGAVAGLLLILAGCWLSTDGRLPPGLARRFSRGCPAPLDPPPPVGEVRASPVTLPAPS